MQFAKCKEIWSVILRPWKPTGLQEAHQGLDLHMNALAR